MKMKVTRIKLEKDKLLMIPETERTFFIALGHIINEVNALTKMLYWASRAPERNEVESDGKFTLLLLFIHLLSGKLNESWELFRKSFFGTKLSRELEPQLEGKFLESLEELKKYFGQKNSIKLIRNRFAFHYSPEELSNVLSEIDEELFIYLEPNHAPNNLFCFAELLSANALLSVLPNLDPHDAYKALVDELFDVSIWFAQLSEGLMVLIIGLYYEDKGSGKPEEIELKNLMELTDIYIPWFAETSNVIPSNSDSP